MKTHKDFNKKITVVFYGSYLLCALVFALSIFALTFIFSTSYTMAALLFALTLFILTCVCYANREALKTPMASANERNAIRRYALILSLCCIVYCALSFLPKPLIFSATSIVTLMLCASGTGFLAFISMTLLTAVVVCFNAMGLQTLIALIALSAAITVLFDKAKENVNNKALIIVILILQPAAAYIGNYPLAQYDKTDFIAMMITCEVITYIFLLFVVRFVGRNITYWIKDRYLLLNDQTYSLIQEIKTHSQKKYQECMHGVYFTERVAEKTGLNLGLINSGMYYMYLGILTENDTDEEIKKIAKEHKFPEEMLELLLECRLYPKKPKSPEAAVVIITLVIVKEVLKWLENNVDKQFNANKDIELICDKIYKGGYLDDSELTTGDWLKMKNVFKNGGNYYEFFMRK